METQYIIIVLIIILLIVVMKNPLKKFFSEKVIVWIYNPILTNSNKWKSFYSRRSVQDTTGLVKLCINSAKFNLGKDYDIRIFNQDDLDTLIPESLESLYKCKTKKMVDKYIKYAIIHKYGGIWLPNSTIVLNSLVLNIKEYKMDRLLLFGLNHENYQSGPGYSDNIIASRKNSDIVRNILSILDKSLNSFNYDNMFNRNVNSYINSRPGDLYFSPKVLQYDMSDDSIEKRDIVSSFNNRLIDYENFSFYYIPADEFEKYPAFTFMLKLTPHDILTSNTFISDLLKYSVKNENVLVYSAILNQ